MERPMIYTGYQWRPMKDDEIKLMDPWRVRKYKLKEPEAGDIYENTTKNYLVGINFADSIQAESEEEARAAFVKMYGIDGEWLFVEVQKPKEESDFRITTGIIRADDIMAFKEEAE